MSTLTADLQFLNLNNQDILQSVGQGGGVQFGIAWNGVLTGSYGTAPVPVAASGALNAHVGATYVITKAGVAALTLAAPTAGVDDGIEITITSNTANAHSITATALINNGATGSPFTSATLAAFPGAGITLYAYQGKWNILATVGVVTYA